MARKTRHLRPASAASFVHFGEDLPLEYFDKIARMMSNSAEILERALVTNARKYDDAEGDFGEWQPSEGPCPGCGVPGQWHWRSWESKDGGYVDEQYHCRACGQTWWVDGIDA